MLPLPRSLHTAWHWLGMWLGGRDEQTRSHLRRLARRAWLAAVASGLLATANALDLTPAWASALTIGVSWAGVLAFYVLLRGGWTRHRADPSCSFGQLIVAIGGVVVSYGVVEIARGAALQLLCLLLAFEMDRLSPRQLLRASLLAVAMLGFTALARVAYITDTARLALELYDLLMAAVLLPAAIWVGTEIGRLHDRLLRQRGELARTLAQLEHLSSRDALTGLANRRRALALLEQEHTRQRRAGQAFGVAILDIDWFKQVNDRHGHGVGDRVLQQFAAVTAAVLPPTDTLARWGGEEFLLLMPACGAAEGLARLQAMRDAVAAHDWAALAPGLRISFSAGLVTWDCQTPAAAGTPAVLLERADAALYAAKARGRDCCVAADAVEAATGWAAAPTPVCGATPRPVPDRSSTAVAATVLATASASITSSACTPPTSITFPTQATPAAPAPRRPAEAPEPADAPGPLATRRHRSRRQRAWNLLVGRDPAVREALRLPLLGCVLHLSWIVALEAFAVPAGHLDPFHANLVIAFNLLTSVGSYALIRSGATRRLQDPGLVLLQLACACAATMYGYVIAPVLRPSLLHLMCVLQVFGMVTLRPRAARLTGVAGVATLLAAATAMLAQQQPELPAELLKLALACFVVGRLAVLSHEYSLVRERVATEQQQLAGAVAAVQELVVRDALTGLFNRKHMQDLLQHERERFRRTGVRFCVALIDVDHFKQVNDRWGHHTGDEVLAGVARAAQQALRDSDVICRWGGEEFLVLMPDTEPVCNGLKAMARLRSSVRRLPAPAQAPGLAVTFSAGLATPLDDETIEQTLARADRALYAAKASGRNRDMVAVEHAAGPSPGGASGTAAPARHHPGRLAPLQA
jgi:diguanylate cyclase (GGDEF)-like protein